MPEQEPHQQLENLVEEPGEAEKAARSLQEAAASGQTLQGFQAINNERIPEDLENEGLSSAAEKK